MKKIWLTVIAAAVLTGCASANVDEPVRYDAGAEWDAKYTTETVQRRDVTSDLLLYCKYSYNPGVGQYFATGGVLAGVYVSQGDYVSKGDLIATLDTYQGSKDEYESQSGLLEELEEDIADIEDDRDRKLAELEIRYRYGELTTSQYEEMSAEVASESSSELVKRRSETDVCRMKIERAYEEMNNAAIYSSVTGVVSSVIRGGAIGRQVETYYEIANISELGAQQFVSYETEYADLFNVGEEYTLSTSGGVNYTAVVSEVADYVIYLDPVLSDNIPPQGTMASLTKCVGEAKNALTISRVSLHKSGDDYCVYYLDSDNVRRMKNVEIGLIGNSFVQILSGLSENETIIR